MNNKRQILCVEDDAAILMPLRYALEREDWQVSWASTGLQAIQMLQQQDFDFIILDVGLPDLNGFEVCNLLKANPATASIPIIFVTARTDDISLGFSVGGNDYISKPVDKAALMKVLEKVMAATRKSP